MQDLYGFKVPFFPAKHHQQPSLKFLLTSPSVAWINDARLKYCLQSHTGCDFLPICRHISSPANCRKSTSVLVHLFLIEQCNLRRRSRQQKAAAWILTATHVYSRFCFCSGRRDLESLLCFKKTQLKDTAFRTGRAVRDPAQFKFEASS